MSEATANVVPIETPDVFEGIPDLTSCFTRIADDLSLWCSLYGLREERIVFDDILWRNEIILTFRIRDTNGAAISPFRYSPLLPDVPKVFVRRFHRIRRFISTQHAFRRHLYECEWRVRSFLATNRIGVKDIEVVTRWAQTGRVIMKIVPKASAPLTARRFMTHLRHDL